MKTVNCPRCGGSGKTEHTHIVHGVCFLCKGNGVVSETTFVLTEEKKQAKEAKKLEVKIQAEIEEENKWIALHNEAKANFEKQVQENNFDLFKVNGFDTCFKIFEYKKQPFTKELFESIIDDFGGSFKCYKDCRLALCKFFRLNGVFNSKFEYNHDSDDYNEYR